MTNPALLRLGWTVLIPADPPQAAATGTDVVRPGDTLTSIAAADGLPSWHPLWQANANRPEPDGDRFTNPDLIRPGWVLAETGPTRRPGRITANRTHAARPPATATAANHRCANRPTPRGANSRTPRPGAATRRPADRPGHGDGRPDRPRRRSPRHPVGPVEQHHADRRSPSSAAAARCWPACHGSRSAGIGGDSSDSAAPAERSQPPRTSWSTSSGSCEPRASPESPTSPG